jgi:two-component system, NtrC family, sensor histidine kinase KinB
VAMSLKTKLMIGFCGLLSILVTVGVLSVRTVSESSTAIDRISRENYDTVAACYRMKEAISRLDRMAQVSLWEEYPDLSGESRPAIAEFEKNLKFQQGNVTVAGELEATGHLEALWAEYLRDYQEFLRSETVALRREAYRNRLLPQSQAVRDAAQHIVELNLNNMVSVDGRVRQRALETRQTMLVLVLSGVVIAVLFIAVVLPSILRPIAGLTRSVRAIREGNLDLVVKVRSQDEIGQLAGAVNDMAVSLREFRRTDRSRFHRTQRATLLVLESLSSAVAICNQRGEIELANERAQKLFGLKPEATVSAAGNSMLTELFGRACRELRPIKPASCAEAIQVFRDGEERFFLPEAIPILDERRELAGVTLVLSDVTDLRQLCELKGGLIATVSHELKTPLTSVRLAIHALLSEKVGPLTPKQVELLAAARNDSDRLHRIIMNLLEMSHMESGRMSVEKRPVAPEQLVLRATEEFQTAFLDRGIHLKLDLPSDLPEVLADPVRIQPVFTNLLHNALRHTPPGGEISILVRGEGKGVHFVVEDTGSGIPKEYLPLVFEKFFRVPGQEGESETGLGLAIVKEILELHGGHIEVDSEEGKGTRFAFDLEAAQAGETAALSQSRPGSA